MYNPLQIGQTMFRCLNLRVLQKRRLIKIMWQDKALPHASRQTDLPGQYVIDVDYPTEDQAIKNHYLARIVVMLDGSEIKVTRGSSTDQQSYLFEDWKMAYRDAVAMITTY